MSGLWVQFSSGAGPAECAWATARAAEAFRREANDQGVGLRMIEVVAGPEPGTSRSVLFELEGEPPAGWLAGWLGTIQWVGKSPYRPHHKRRNWFLGVSAFEPPTEAAYPAGALRVETMRAGGPGGQHQNKTASAVRVTHVPTGLVAIARDGRSQHQNRQLALRRLDEALADRQAQARAEAKGDRWGQHQALERGNPVRTYEGPGFVRKA